MRKNFADFAWKFLTTEGAEFTELGRLSFRAAAWKSESDGERNKVSVEIFGYACYWQIASFLAMTSGNQ